jgi:phosphatidate cytidylyltransferase
VGWAVAATALGAIVVCGAIEVFGVVPPERRAQAGAAALVFLSASLAPMLAFSRGPGAFAFVVLVTAATDSFAELLGRLVGRRKLCPRLSPQKTVAGLWGGLGMAVLVALLLGFLLPGAHGLRLGLVGLATALGAVAGDLLFSAIKRAVGVKDFSGLLPAHGGVLDRFDSLVLAAPAFQISRALLLG